MSWWQYLVLVNVYLLLFYGFYVLLLSRETFFQLNRIYLVTASVLSFFIPLIQSSWVKNLFITQQVQYRIYSSPVMIYQFKPIVHTQITVGTILLAIYLAGMAFLISRLVFQLLDLKKVINQADSSAAFSFFKKIHLGRDVEDNPAIAAHENVHAQQWHSADILMIEAVMIINWFNPIVYFYRFAIKHIHEFIADRQAIKAGTDKADYALLLLSKTFNAPAHQITNPFFNNSLLKQRIIMMQKNNSHRISLVKYCLSAPLFILMLVLSSATVSNSKTVNFINKKAENVFLAPADGITIDEPAAITIDADTTSKKTPASKKTGKVFASVQQVPQFNGGFNAFAQYLAKSIKYPAGSREKGVQGRVIIRFIVETDGSLSDVTIVRGVAADIDNEALRVMRLSPKWLPGIENGKQVRVQYSVPISFTLADDGPAHPAKDKVGVVSQDKNYFANPITSMSSLFNLPVCDTVKKVKYDAAAKSAVSTGSPIYLLDGKKIQNISNIDANNIKSINVLKLRAATDLYGPDGVNGVVIIKSKNTSLADSVK